MQLRIRRAVARVAAVMSLAVLTGCGSVAGTPTPAAAPVSEQAAAQPSPVVATPEPTSPPDDPYIAASTMLSVSDLPAGWTAVGPPPTVQSGPIIASGCMPPALVAYTTASTGEDFSYLLNAQGLEKGHLSEGALVFETPADVDAYMEQVVTPSYGACVADQIKGETALDGVTPIGAATNSVVPLPVGFRGVHVHVSFRYLFGGLPKLAEDELVILAGTRVRVVLQFDTCCTPFPAALVDHVLSTVAAKIEAAEAT